MSSVKQILHSMYSGMILLVLAVRMVAILKITGQRLVLELFPGLSDAQNDEWLSTFLSAHRLVVINLLTLINFLILKIF